MYPYFPVKNDAYDIAYDIYDRIVSIIVKSIRFQILP